MISRDAKRDRRAPIMTDDGEARVFEMLTHEHPDVVSYSFLVVAGTRPRGIAEAPHIGRDKRVLVREQRHHPPPFIPGLRPSVEQHDRRAIPYRDVMNSHAFE